MTVAQERQGGAAGGPGPAGGGGGGSLRSGAGRSGGRVVAARQAAGADDPLAGRNEVRLVGRVSGTPEQRELPSGDSLVAWRVVVDRPPGGRTPPAGVRATTVDTLDCVAWTPGLRRTARALADGDVVEVTGSLRRRFWRAGAGAASRTEVEVAAVRRLARAGGG